MNKIQMYIKMLMDYKSLLLLYVFSSNTCWKSSNYHMIVCKKQKQEEELIPDLKGLEAINPVK